jgi:signal transduction histidine kinase
MRPSPATARAKARASAPASAPARESRGPLLVVLWITLSVIGITFFSTNPTIETYVRPLFFLGLSVFFVALGRTEPRLRSEAFRMMETGFFLLFASNFLGVILRRSDSPDLQLLAFNLDQGAGFLLGLAVIAYGIVLWVPEILRSQRLLQAHLAEVEAEHLAQGQALERARGLMERQEALVTLGELAAGLAHELKNPIAIVESALHALEEPDLDEDERARCHRVLHRSIGKANRNITGLLELGRDHPYRPALHSSRELLDKARDLVLIDARRARVEIEIAGASDSRRFYGDQDLLLQVLINLLRNAIQAGPHMGPIRMLFELRDRQSGSCRFLVEDLGTGIPADVLPKLGTPFFSTKSDGTGLGLSICEKILSQHSGSFGLSNRERRGARAELILPGCSLGWSSLPSPTGYTSVQHG